MGKKRILIVDDEQEMVKAMQIRLEHEGYEVLVATDGQEALDKARSQMPDLILMDIMLPKLDGYKVCRFLKFDAKYKNIPIIILTAKVQSSDEEIGLQVGADAYITKPFERGVVISKIKELLKEDTGSAPAA